MQQWPLAVAVFAFVGVGGPAQAAPASPDPKTVGTIKVNSDEVPQPVPVRDVSIDYGGFIKADALFSVYSDGDVGTPGGIRDFYAPAAIPVAASSAAEDSSRMFDMHAKETRMFFKINADVADHRLGGYIEMDFLANPGSGNEVVTNAYTPSLRRAFVTYNNWLMGQEWTTFVSLASLPDTIDYVRWPSEGTAFGRQPMLRYTMAGVLGGDLLVALESSETLARAGGTFVTGDSVVPDLVVRMNWKPSFGDVGVAVLGRNLRADNVATGAPAPFSVANDSTTGVGVSLGGRINAFGNDDVRFQLNGGEGIGRYLALAAAPDVQVNAEGELEPVSVFAGYVAYRRVWNQRWRSTLSLSGFQADNDTALTGTAVTKSLSSARVNLLYSPVEKLTFGLEFTHGVRELENGQDGSLDRLQFSTVYSY